MQIQCFVNIINFIIRLIIVFTSYEILYLGYLWQKIKYIEIEPLIEFIYRVQRLQVFLQFFFTNAFLQFLNWFLHFESFQMLPQQVLQVNGHLSFIADFLHFFLFLLHHPADFLSLHSECKKLRNII